VYRVNAIILYRQPIRDNHIRTVLFSEEFGRITAWEKRQEIGDIGNMVEVLIERIAGQNQIKKLDIRHALSTDSWSYKELIEYLKLLHILYEALPE
jgi:recombinational DNA repair protein (RecF pathway)